MHIPFPTCNTWHLNTVTQKTIPSLKYQARRNNLLVPKGVITCRHRSKHSFGDVYFKRRYTIIKPDVILLLGVLQTFCFQKPYQMKNTFLLVYYDVEKILILFILDTSKYLLWQTVTTQMSQPPTQQAFSDRF